MNVARLSRSRRKPRAGDEFAFRVPDQTFGFGRVIRTDAIVGPWERVLLVYIYSEFSRSKDTMPSLRRGSLLLPPLLTNAKPWTEGYFETIAHVELSVDDILSPHCFHDIRGFFVDEYGNRLPDRIDPCGEYSIES